VDAALRFLSGDRSSETLDALEAGLRRWAAQEGAGDAIAVNRYIGLPASPCKLRKALRDDCLRRAAALIPAPTPWARASALAEESRLFRLRKWNLWQHLDMAPLRATPIQALLFEARKCAALPTTTRQFHNLLL